MNITGTATVKVWWVHGGYIDSDVGIESGIRQIAIYDEEGNIVTQTNVDESNGTAGTDGIKNDLFISELTISKPGKYYLGNVGNANYYFKVEVVVTPYEAPEIPESMKVTTHNTYGFNDMAEPPVVDSFTAPVAGYYTFGLPAGLGLWSKASMDENPWGMPDVDFYENALGENYTVELDEGEVFEFYVGAMTAEDWLITISYSEEAPAVPTEITLQDGENKFTVQEIDLTNGVTAYLNVYEDATYTFAGTGLFINVYDGYGMLLTRGFELVEVELSADYWNAYVIVLGSETVGDYAVTVSAVTPTNLYDGENTVTVDADGADCVYYVMNNGDYFFNVTGATVVVYDSMGEALTANEDGSYTLEAYVQYKIVVTSETAGDYTVEVVAPIFLSTYEDTTVTVGTDSVVVFFETGEKGHYTVSGEGLTIVVTDAEGNTVEASALLPSNTLYTVTITAAEAGDYAVNLSFTAPIGAYDNPHKVESLPATLTPSLIAEYDNYYYEFTASATGHVTLTYTVASGALYSVSLDGVDAVEGTVTVPVVKGMTYQVYFSAASAAEVSATLTLEAGELTEAEWKDIIVYTTIEFANGTNVSITQDWMTEEHQIFCYQVDADWNYLFKAYYSYTVTVNEDGSLTLKLAYLEGNENNVGTAPAIGDIKVELVDGEWVATCVHTYANGVCSICGGKITIPEIYEFTENTNVVVEGTVTKITYAWSDSAGNMSIVISDDAGNTIACFKLYTQVGLGDYIKVTGEYSSQFKNINEGATAEILVDHVCSEWSDATCTAPKTCTECGATEGDKLAHTYVDGVCSCGATEGPKTIKANLSVVSGDSTYYVTGAISSGSLTTSTDVANAAALYLETSDNEVYYIYTLDGNGNKNYIYMTSNGTTKFSTTTDNTKDGAGWTLDVANKQILNATYNTRALAFYASKSDVRAYATSNTYPWVWYTEV